MVKSAGFGRPVSGFDLAVLAPNAAFTVVPGDSMAGTRRGLGLRLSARAGPPRKVMEADSSFMLAIAGDSARGNLYVLDAAKTAPRCTC